MHGRPAPGPVDLNDYNGFQFTSERHPALPPKAPRPERVEPYVPSQPGYQPSYRRDELGKAPSKEWGRVLSWDYKGGFGWIRPDSGKADVFVRVLTWSQGCP